jgi:hypothetical protein
MIPLSAVWGAVVIEVLLPGLLGEPLNILGNIMRSKNLTFVTVLTNRSTRTDCSDFSTVYCNKLTDQQEDKRMLLHSHMRSCMSLNDQVFRKI